MRNRLMTCRKRAFFYRGVFLLLLLLLGISPRSLSAQKLYLFCGGGCDTDYGFWSSKAVSDTICRNCDPFYLVPYNNQDGEEFGSDEWTGPDIFSSENAHDDILEAIDRCPAGNDDTIFFYWTGRSGQDDEGDYLLMPEGCGRPKMYRSEILEALRKKNPRLIVFITDSCSTYLPLIAIAPPPPEATVLVTEGVPLLYASLFFQCRGILDLDSSCPEPYTCLEPMIAEWDPIFGTVFSGAFQSIMIEKRLMPYTWETFVKEAESIAQQWCPDLNVLVHEYPEPVPCSIPDSVIAETGRLRSFAEMWEMTDVDVSSGSDGWSAPRFHPEKGDRIIEVNDQPVSSESEYRNAIADSDEGVMLLLADHRTGKRYKMQADLWLKGSEIRLGIDIAEDEGEGVRVTGVIPGSPGERCSFKLAPSPSENLAAGTEPGEKKTMTVNGVDYTFCWCPPGEFMMGSPETEVGHESCEKDHIVQLNSGFWMLECEVTQQMWESITNDPDMDQRTSGEEGQGDHYPMYTVNWDECQEFCRQFSEYSGYHAELPTEAQWEYACRAGSENAYAGTGILVDMGWYGENSGKTVHEVKGKEPNAWGLYDMHGNLWEWCSDWFEEDYYKHSPPDDPEGPGYGQHRVIRGGDWKLGSRFCRSAFRFEYDQPRRDPCIGFRFILVPGAAMPVPEWDDESAETEESIPAENNISADKEISENTVLDDEGDVIIEGTVLTRFNKDVSKYSIPDSVTEIGWHAFAHCYSLTKINIPESVTKIGSRAFSNCYSLTEINIPKSVTEIGENAFTSCSSLTKISIPDSVTTIGEDAFLDCSSLTSVDIPDSVTTIGGGAFAGCSSLTEINIPDSVTTIEGSTFEGCSSLTEINIPESVTEIESGAFFHCSSLTEIHVSPDNSLFHCEDGVLFGGTVLHTFPAGKDVQTYNIPDSVTAINAAAFDGCSSLTEINIPESVTKIGWHAFEGCSSLTEINIPESVTEIGSGAFLRCSSLAKIHVSSDNSLFHCEDGILFEGTVLHTFPAGKDVQTYNIPDSVTAIGAAAFDGCSSLTEINIPESVTKIGWHAFEGCSSLTEINIPESVITIEDSVFRDCSSLTSINIPKSVTEIGHCAFYGCSSLSKINIPESVTKIGAVAFDGCSSLTEINIPDSVTEIEHSSFYGCSSLTEIKIPESVTDIDQHTFTGCSSLEKVYAPKDLDFSKSGLPDNVQIIRE